MKIMKHLSRFFITMLGIVAVCACTSQTDYTSMVDVKIGSGGHGHVFVGANVPFGMVQLGPSSITEGWDWCSSYHESDSTVMGFAHTHLSGTGCADLSDVLLMPVTGTDLTYARGTQDDKTSGLWSYADRTTEVAEPGYYSVRLERYPVTAEMTATARVGLTSFTFDKGSKDAAVVIDLFDGNSDRTTSAGIEILDETHITGWRHSSGWAPDQKLWFAAEFSKPFKNVSTHGEGGMFWRFDFDDPGNVMVKVALSPTSSAKASDNMAAELPGWDFSAVRKSAKAAWNAELSKIDARTSDEETLKIFYTALYHTMLSPALYSDNGDEDRYTILSLWDTYRALMPLFSIMHPEKEKGMMNTFIELYEKEGKLPVWHLWGSETWCMIGNPGVIVLADAITKGFDGVDLDKAWEALKVSSMRTDRGQGARMEYGYIPSELLNQSVAYETEYAIADWAVAQAAKTLGKEDEYAYFYERSHSWRRHFDPESGFVRGLTCDGKFREPFNPYFSDHSYDDYCEGNAWHYTWLAPHDVEGMIENWGSRENMVKALDELFTADSKLEGVNVSADISGLIGQYAHGNEPSHHVAYLYSMAGAPDKTADIVRRICSELYTTTTEGLSGNEDAGQMSAWYVLSAMGMYQVEPACGRFYFGSPLFDEVTLKLPEGRSLKLVARNNSPENGHIKSVTLNGNPYTLPYISYQDIMAGGVLEFEMGK